MRRRQRIELAIRSYNGMLCCASACCEEIPKLGHPRPIPDRDNVMARTLIALFLGLALTATSASAVRAADTQTSLLALKIRHYEVQQADMEAALRALRATDYARILFGFERVAAPAAQPQPTFSVTESDESLGGIMSDLCRKDPRYTFEVISGQLIHVYPRSQTSDPAGLLNIRVAHFSINEKILPAAVIDRISELAPELHSFLWQRRLAASRGKPAPSSPGTQIHGNMDPTVHFELRNVTVREILNDVVLYSAELRRDTPPDWAGNKPVPTSWMYEFVVQPDAATGLDGIPIWRDF
jgi:hypothetical protein